MKKILIAGGDPGGANALAPVAEALIKDKSLSIHIFAYNQAVDIWTKRGIIVSELSGSYEFSFFGDLLETLKPDLVLTSTSYNSYEYEKCFIRAAREAGIPSISVLDFWSYYSVRFSNKKGERIFVPDIITVMDDHAQKEMLREGFSPESIVITGQPAYDDLIAWKEQFTPEKHLTVRHENGVSPENLLVVFTSEIQFGPVPGELWCPEYSTDEVISELIKTLDEISEENNTGITLVIRPHPRENPSDFQKYRGRFIQVTVSEKSHSRDLVLAADLVAGMTTNLLVESCYLGCIVISLQPGGFFHDPLITNRLGISKAVYNKKEFKPVIQNLLLNPVIRMDMKNRLADFQTDGQATSRIILLIHHIFKKPNISE